MRRRNKPSYRPYCKFMAMARMILCPCIHIWNKLMHIQEEGMFTMRNEFALVRHDQQTRKTRRDEVTSLGKIPYK